MVGVVDAGFPILLADGRGSRMTRSVVYYAKDKTVLGGEEAWRPAGGDGVWISV
jgi:molecular chaperone DnaK